MQSPTECISYRLPDGHIFSYIVDHSVGITTENINGLVSAYFEHTGHVPETIFVRTDLFTGYINSMQKVQRYNIDDFPVGLISNISMWLSVGKISVTTIPDAYIPLLIGSQKDYDDNNINWLFEDIVLADCERE